MARRKESRLKSLIRLLTLVVGGMAVAKELKLPPDRRTWHGDVGGVVPYDFRFPTIERARERLWNPQGPLIGPQVFGVGWGVNFGALFEILKDTFSGPARDPR